MPPVPEFGSLAEALRGPPVRLRAAASEVDHHLCSQEAAQSRPRPEHAAARARAAAAVDQDTLGAMLDEALHRQTAAIVHAIQQQLSQWPAAPAASLSLPGPPGSPSAQRARRPQSRGAGQVGECQTPQAQRARLPQVGECQTPGRQPPLSMAFRAQRSSSSSRVSPVDVEASRELSGCVSLAALRCHNYTALYKQIVVQDEPYVSMVQQYVEQCVKWWNDLVVAKTDFHTLRTSRCLRLVDQLVRSYAFRVASVLLIFANIVFIVFEVNHGMREYGRHDFRAAWQHKIFTTLYLLELVLRMLSGGRFFFIGPGMRWNWFDLIVVLGSLVSELRGEGSAEGWIRALKVTRVASAGRGLKVLSMLGMHEMELMIKQVFGCFVSLVSCFALLAFITFLFALYFMYSLLGLPPSAEAANELVAEFGSVDAALVTLLKATTGGVDWGDIYEHLKSAGSTVAIAFIGYILFFVIAIWNIVTATFVEKMVKMTKSDTEESELKERLEELEGAVELRELFKQVDLNNSKTITEEELHRCLEDSKFRQYLATHGVHFKEACAFFAMLFETGIVKELNIDSLVAYCRRIKGTASSIDLHTMRYELTTLLQLQEERLHAMDRKLQQSQSQAQQQLSHMESPTRAGVRTALVEDAGDRGATACPLGAAGC